MAAEKCEKKLTNNFTYHKPDVTLERSKQVLLLQLNLFYFCTVSARCRKGPVIKVKSYSTQNVSKMVLVDVAKTLLVSGETCHNHGMFPVILIRQEYMSY